MFHNAIEHSYCQSQVCNNFQDWYGTISISEKHQKVNHLKRKKSLAVTYIMVDVILMKTPQLSNY